MTGDSGDAAKLEKTLQPLECRLKMHSFSDKLAETQIHFQVLRMEQSFFVWIGISPPRFQNFAVAVQNRFVSLNYVLEQTKCVLIINNNILLNVMLCILLKR